MSVLVPTTFETESVLSDRPFEVGTVSGRIGVDSKQTAEVEYAEDIEEHIGGIANGYVLPAALNTVERNDALGIDQTSSVQIHRNRRSGFGETLQVAGREQVEVTVQFDVEVSVFSRVMHGRRRRLSEWNAVAGQCH